MTQIVLIIGSDRSGTHWIAETLRQHPAMTGTIESYPHLWYSWAMAANREHIPILRPRLKELYTMEMEKCTSEVYFDKSHTNIWLVDELLEDFPNVKFIGTDRNAYATISSLLRHSGAMRDVMLGYCAMSMPNMLMGAQSHDQYGKLTKAQRCAAKWQTHHLFLEHLKTVLTKDQLYVNQFERFAAEPMEVIGEIQDFIGVERLIKDVKVKHSAVDKWKDFIPMYQLDQIERYFEGTKGEVYSPEKDANAELES